MTLKDEVLTRIRKEGVSNGYNISSKDICFCLILININSINFAYQNLFGSTPDKRIISDYNNSDMIVWLKERLKRELLDLNIIPEEGDDISIDEQITALNKHIKQLDAWLEKEEIDPDKYSQRLVMTRSKIAALKGGKSRTDKQYIQVFHKYNTVCPHCNKEYERALKEPKKQY